MSEPTLAYGIGHAKKHHGFYPRLINITEDKIDKLAFDPVTGALILLAKNDEQVRDDQLDYFDVLEVFYPHQEFVTALRDQANDDCRVLSKVAVDEMARNIMGIGSKKKVDWVETVTLEVSKISAFEFVKRDDHGQYIYRVELANGWNFTLIVISERDPGAMTNIGHTDTILGIDTAMIELFPQARSHSKRIEAVKQTYIATFDIYCLKRRAIYLDDYEEKSKGYPNL